MFNLLRLRGYFSIFNTLKTSLKQITPKLPASPCTLAEILRTTEAKIRNQMLNPKGDVIEKQEAELISLLNGCKIKSKYARQQKKRTPVITIMGHVDHGKTTLLDYLRKSNIAEGEYGGITQKIGAFHVEYKGEKITVIDTPGHQAFVNMRIRGATVTDMIVLVISATQGVRQQTIEVINLAQKCNIPIIIAINKIDLLEADPQSVQKELIDRGLSLLPYGGTIPVVHISGKTGLNIDLLTQLILEQAEETQIKARFDGPMEASVLEGRIDENEMVTTTLLIQQGVLKVGDYIVANDMYCKVKAIYDDRKNQLREGTPGMAVEVTGFKDLPATGDLIFQVQNEAKARYIIEKKMAGQKKQKQILAPSTSKIKIENRREKRKLYRGFADLWLNKFKEVEDKLLEEMEQISAAEVQTPEMKQLLEEKQKQLRDHKLYVHQYLEDVIKKENTVNIVLRTPDRNSEQTMLREVEKIKVDVKNTLKIDLNILKTEIGDIVQNDVKECQLFGGIIFAFGVAVKPDAVKLIKQLKVTIKTHKLLHNFIEDLKKTCLDKTRQDEINLKEKGTAKVSDIFKVSTNKKVYREAAGIKIEEGRICKKYKFKVFRNGKQISKLLTVESLNHFKKEVIELKKGDECTILFVQDFKFQKNDVIKSYE